LYLCLSLPDIRGAVDPNVGIIVGVKLMGIGVIVVLSDVGMFLGNVNGIIGFGILSDVGMLAVAACFWAWA
jgi:hypothetical protein